MEKKRKQDEKRMRRNERKSADPALASQDAETLDGETADEATDEADDADPTDERATSGLSAR